MPDIPVHKVISTKSDRIHVVNPVATSDDTKYARVRKVGFI